MTERTAVIESCRAGERVALERLGAAAGGRSLCSLSRAGASVPTAKYHEGAAAALAEARRAVASLPDDVGDAAAVRAALLGVGARWHGEPGTADRSGPDWAGYLAGGIDALDQMTRALVIDAGVTDEVLIDGVLIDDVLIDDVLTDDVLTDVVLTDDEGRDAVSRTDRELDGVVRVRPDLPVLDEVAGADAAARPEVVPDSRAGRSGGRLARARAHWPMRRIVTVVAGTPALLALLLAASGGQATAIPGGWTALAALIAVMSATTLATYLPLPGTGRRLDLGCTPCAAAAALSVVIAGAVLVSTPHDVPTAILAAGVAAFGLRQRLANPSSCAA